MNAITRAPAATEVCDRPDLMHIILVKRKRILDLGNSAGCNAESLGVEQGENRLVVAVTVVEPSN